MYYVKVWCEYDMGGSFGGNNNEDVVVIDPTVSKEEITERLERYLTKRLSLSTVDLEDLWGWEFVAPIIMGIE